MYPFLSVFPLGLREDFFFGIFFPFARTGSGDRGSYRLFFFSLPFLCFQHRPSRLRPPDFT